MTRNSIALMRDGSVMADSDLVDFLSGPTDSVINFNGSADLHTPIHPPPFQWLLSGNRYHCFLYHYAFFKLHKQNRNISFTGFKE